MIQKERLLRCDSSYIVEYSFFTETHYQGSPSVAADGTNWLVVWQDQRNGNENSIYGTRVTSTGTVVDNNSLAINTSGRTRGPLR